MRAKVPTLQARDATAKSTRVEGLVFPDTVIAVRSSSSTACDSDDTNLCQKPTGGNMTVIIACSVIIPVILALIVLYILHRRVVRRQRLEDLKDPHKSMDFGLDENPGQAQVGKRKSIKMGAGDKDTRTRYDRQMSLDMNLSSPYLLPPEVQGSRESMNSLARTLHHNEDPYRPVASYLAGDEKGRMTPSRMTVSSYSKEIGRTSRATTLDSFPGRHSSIAPKCLSSPLDGSMSMSPPPAYKETFPARAEPVIPQIAESPPLQQDPMLPVVKSPPTPAQSGAWKPSPVPKGPTDSAVDVGGYRSSALETSQQRDVEPTVYQAQSPVHMSPPAIKSLPAIPQEMHEDFAQDPEVPQLYPLEAKGEPRGRNMQRLSRLYDHVEPKGLHVPNPNNKRLSVGFRPLPPDDITESEDPEYRANRIRSFYKETMLSQAPDWGPGPVRAFRTAWAAAGLFKVTRHECLQTRFIGLGPLGSPSCRIDRDDSFSLLGSIDFAPPETFAERASGRSQSPAGERRPYKLNLPIASPLVTAFEELPALPSPHVLRESSTFTALEFAPPRKFTESDSRSETGSIRSNRSGISAGKLGAIRSGAGRVSRLPGDSVFTQASLAAQLKPQWGIRP
ncbi:hypothetical protein P8C59_000174 [Phyllachora maydis]|uniref:Uncharacterized protein n=1 Tax=Phyllachora maydis TaxID=1825666 RepID=A0AAD9M8F2_9PEZI|nr:hypothetical protein P8C59_000174 [Phyllachora maydis]